MDLTVIVLNFNVRYLLESCLESVITATKSIPTEIIVVDNASSDDSVSMVQSKFPQITLVVNAHNTGFAKGNNLAIAQAKGKHILILNPDTLVNEQAIRSALDYLIQQDRVAAVGVKMIDGQEKYLQESKRGFPTFWASWWKLTGINRWFSHHPVLNHYYLGQLNENVIQEVEVLTGAFFMVKKKVLDQTGGFDEHFFMYGEDIDLSFRIRQLGYQLVYLGTSSIIHLKGRSSTAHSYQYVRNFYQAMLVFIKKYYKHPFARWMMTIGIWVAGLFSWIKRKIFFHFLPLTDLILLSAILLLVQRGWAQYWFQDVGYFQDPQFYWNAVCYITIWFLTLFLFQAYRIQQASPAYLAFKAILSGTAVILIVYALLPENWRSSRAVILLSGFLLSIVVPWSRVLLKPVGMGFRALFIGNQNSEANLNSRFRFWCTKNYFAYVSRMELNEWLAGQNMNPDELREKLKLQAITHVIVDRTSNWKSDLLQIMKIAGIQYTYLVANSDKDENLAHNTFIPGLTQVDIRLYFPVYRVVKYMVNTIISIFILPWGWVKEEIRRNYLNLLKGRKQWVSYQPPIDAGLPAQRPGLWHPGIHKIEELGDRRRDINFEYAQNYHPIQDFRIILSNLFKIS